MNRRALSEAERRDWLRLSRTDNVGPVTFEQLLKRYGTAAKALQALPELSRRGGRATPLRPASEAEIDAELAAGAALGARLIAACEPDFPPLLVQLDPPPPVIWTRGHAHLLLKPAVAIVGARIASAAGQRFARGMAMEIGQAGYLVVSGLARGIDAAAHEGALPTGTAAVLGGGVDDVYPPEHAELYARLVEQGCIVSESKVGHRAQARDFPRRNRLISGLSRGVVVVEAEMRSGSLITARLAGEQNRDVFAVPGSPLDPRAKGTNDLIRQGAVLCESAEDVLRVVSSGFALRERERPDYGEAAFGADLDPAVDAARPKVEAALGYTPTPRDEIARSAGVPAPIAAAALVELALAGRAVLLPGGLVVKGDG